RLGHHCPLDFTYLPEVVPKGSVDLGEFLVGGDLFAEFLLLCLYWTCPTTGCHFRYLGCRFQVKPPAVPTTGRTFWSTNLESRARIRGIACANQAPMVSRSVPRLPSRFTPGYHGFHSPLRPEKNLTGNRQMAKKKRKPPKRSPNRAIRSRPQSFSPPELPDRRAIEGVMKGFLGEMLGGPAAGTPLD